MAVPTDSFVISCLGEAGASGIDVNRHSWLRVPRIVFLAAGWLLNGVCAGQAVGVHISLL